MKKRRLIVLTAVLLLQVGLAIDVCRQPDRQVSGKLYIAAVHAYQHIGRPMLVGKVACRFRPTCSDYSIVAVEKHGTVRGLVLTCRRLMSCTNKVKMGTSDPVPES